MSAEAPPAQGSGESLAARNANRTGVGALPPASGDWLNPDDPLLTQEERRASGKQRRKEITFEALGAWEPPDDRVDPIDLLEEQAKTRLPQLVSIRYGRMLASTFPYYRGTPIVQAHDLGSAPNSGLIVQACGDAHVLNFGVFATPERNLIFDVNDFDETIPAPFEWDVKRLAASLVVAGRQNGFPDASSAEIARAAALSYAHHIAEYSQMTNLDIWYSRIDAASVSALSSPPDRKRVEKLVKKAEGRTNMTALPKLTTIVDGQRRIVDDPPLITHPFDEEHVADLSRAFQGYRETLPADRQVLIDRYRPVDVVLKVVGVGSVGTRCFLVLFLAEGGTDPLFLQIKEAERSVLEPFVKRSTFENQGERVVMGQRIMQAASDMFLGWTEGNEGRHFYLRQLRDMKGSMQVETMDPIRLGAAGQICAWTLARAHARSGDADSISGYVGKGEAFAAAIGRYAVAYADQVERDYQHFRDAANRSRIFATPGL